MTETPPPVPPAKQRFRLPVVAWVGIGVAGLLILGVAGYAGYVGVGVANATNEFVAEFEETMTQVSSDFDRFHEHGGASLATVTSEADLEERLTILETLSNHLEIGLADATTGKRFAAKMRERGAPSAVVRGAVEGFTGEPSMQQGRKWLEAQSAFARAATELLKLAHRHYGAWSTDSNDELTFSQDMDAAVRQSLEAAVREVERTANAADAAAEGLD